MPIFVTSIATTLATALAARAATGGGSGGSSGDSGGGTEGGHWTDLFILEMSGKDKERFRNECGKSGKKRYFAYDISGLDGNRVAIGWMRENAQDAFKDEFGSQPWKYDIDTLSNDQLGEFFDIHISHHNEEKNKVKFINRRDDGDGKECAFEDFIYVDKSGQAASEAWAETLAAVPEQLKTPHSTLYIASVSEGVRRDDAGLIKTDSFKLNWNNLETKAEWKTGVRTKFSEIQDGEVPGTIALMREQIYIPDLENPPAEEDTTHPGGAISAEQYNQYYDLNTGKSQKSPTLRTAYVNQSEHKIGFNVTYGRPERSALKGKYKRFEGDYSTGMDLAIDRVVRQAVKDSKVKSRYNFKRVDTNERFKKKELSFFAGEGQVKETVEISTTAQRGGLSDVMGSGPAPGAGGGGGVAN
jgi:hypothetical protein